jgi:ferredoxin
MRVVVDLAVCQGYAQCAFLAPDAFRLSGPEGLMYDPGPDDEQRARILRAAAACPVQAISVEQPPPAAAGASAGSAASAGSGASHGR